MNRYTKMASFLKHIYKYIGEIENILLNNLLRRFSPGSLAPALAVNSTTTPVPSSSSLTDLLQDPFLWAVPKKRRTAQKRMNRKFGIPGYHWKPFVPNPNILICRECGNHHEKGRLCGYCYKVVMDETKLIQNKIQEELQLRPVEEDVVVLYKGEKPKDPNYWQGKRIIEMDKPRPVFFSQNLMQGSTQKSSESTGIELIPPVK